MFPLQCQTQRKWYSNDTKICPGAVRSVHPSRGHPRGDESAGEAAG